MAKSIIEDIDYIRRRQKELFPNRPYEEGPAEKEKSRIAGDKPTFTMEYRTGGNGEFAGKRIDANGFVSENTPTDKHPTAEKRFDTGPLPKAPSPTATGSVCGTCNDNGWTQTAIGWIECKACGNPHNKNCP